uniref:Heterogeneous nuclear ribonucleoprotein U-like protein 2 (Trinotate prediction) n=1 Tax=Henneguya salminicola TaxID=69463 RepID=A0A6G3MDR3_HENSL
MSETPSSVRKLKVAELREKCQNLGLDTKGTKPILLNRIFSHLGFSEENQESTFLDESSTKINTEEILSKNELSADKINAKQPNSPVSRIDIHASDSDKQEVELDFVNEDLLDLNSPKIDSRRRQASFEIWDEDEAAIKKSSSKIIIPVEVVKDYEVHYMDHVHLDPYVNDLHFQMEDDKFLSGSNITKSQLHNFWCGVLSTHGISEGKACFNCHYVSNITPDDTKQTEHGLRVGFSDPNAGLHLGLGIFFTLGSSKLSTGYDCSGNVYSNGKHVETFKKFAVGDSVTALIDITLTSVTYTFQINGVEAGKPIIADLSEIHVLFPHIFFKNVKFNVDFTCSFGQFSSFDSLKKLLTPGPKPPNSFPECEVENIFVI